ncbi:MAG: DNA mismatch repair protein MutS, partial [Ignavibacteriae bacterium]|nr:DNA mismatch repair protein MutS [Ignavibacteriota bacterium]
KIFENKKHLIKKINKKIGSLVLDKAAMNDMLSGIVDYLNIYFLYDLIKFSTSVGLLKKHQSLLKETYLTIAKLDSSISIASYLNNVQHYCNPTFINKKSITFQNIYHPLIVNAVTNNLIDLDKSLLITGSNMAGKTTFIKTIGINLIFSQSINLCLASKAEIPKLFVKSAIRREDNLEDSKSYFFVEVEELLKFIQTSEISGNYIFLIDEIFRGTNTIERLASSTSVLEYLNINNFVLVTTHDIELQDMLNNKFDMIHFSERVNNNKFFFDYKLQMGPTSSGNAIKLLEIKGYPKSIIENSNKISKSLLNKK